MALKLLRLASAACSQVHVMPATFAALHKDPQLAARWPVSAVSLAAWVHGILTNVHHSWSRTLWEESWASASIKRSMNWK